MDRNARIFVAGHRGLVGSAMVRELERQGFTNLVLRTHAELDLTDGAAVRGFFDQERPEYVVLAAAKVGGIMANSTYPADFIYINLAIELNVIHNAWLTGVKRLLFLGSSCIYPRHAPQPMREEHLLTGPLEPTNRPYALAKISGIELCWSYNRQHGTRYLAAMPTNLYGPGDNYHPQNSHVIPALIRRFHEAKTRGDEAVNIWGTGTPRREFLYSDDMARGCVFLLTLAEDRYTELLGQDDTRTGVFAPPLVNMGAGADLSIAELAQLVKQAVGYAGRIEFDTSKPDGTPLKLMDTSRLDAAGWKPAIGLAEGLKLAYADFLKNHA
jgi:GDP-L-fucose synthase